MSWLRRRRSGRVPAAYEAEHAISEARRQREQAREERERSQAQLNAERRWFRFRLGDGQTDMIAGLIEDRLSRGGDDA